MFVSCIISQEKRFDLKFLLIEIHFHTKSSPLTLKLHDVYYLRICAFITPCIAKLKENILSVTNTAFL